MQESETTTNSLVEQTADILNRFRNSIVRSRRERLIDEDLQAIDNSLSQLHFTELISKETLNQLITQGDSMQRSFRLINQLEREIKDIAEDLDQVNGRKCSLFNCFTCANPRKNKRRILERKEKFQTLDFDKKTRESLEFEHEEIVEKTRSLAHNRRENPNFHQLLHQLETTKTLQTENGEKKLSKLRDYLLQNHSLVYGYIDQPDQLMNEINMAIQFTQLNTHLDHLLDISHLTTSQITQQNLLISKIESQAMESGNLLTDYTLLGHHILGSSTTQLIPMNNTGLGQKVLLNSVL